LPDSVLNMGIGLELENVMKKFALAAVVAVTGTATFAGGLAAPVVEMAPKIIVEEATGGSSGAGLIIPLILIALIAAALSSGD